MALNKLMNCSRAGIDLLRCEINKMTSSAYGESLCSVYPIVIPTISVCIHTAIASGLIARVNKSGEKGHP